MTSRTTVGSMLHQRQEMRPQRDVTLEDGSIGWPSPPSGHVINRSIRSMGSSRGSKSLRTPWKLGPTVSVIHPDSPLNPRCWAENYGSTTEKQDKTRRVAPITKHKIGTVTAWKSPETQLPARRQYKVKRSLHAHTLRAKNSRAVESFQEELQQATDPDGSAECEKCKKLVTSFSSHCDIHPQLLERLIESNPQAKERLKGSGLLAGMVDASILLEVLLDDPSLLDGLAEPLLEEMMPRMAAQGLFMHHLQEVLSHMDQSFCSSMLEAVCDSNDGALEGYLATQDVGAALPDKDGSILSGILSNCNTLPDAVKQKMAKLMVGEFDVLLAEATREMRQEWVDKLLETESEYALNKLVEKREEALKALEVAEAHFPGIVSDYYFANTANMGNITELLQADNNSILKDAFSTDQEGMYKKLGELLKGEKKAFAMLQSYFPVADALTADSANFNSFLQDSKDSLGEAVLADIVTCKQNPDSDAPSLLVGILEKGLSAASDQKAKKWRKAIGCIQQVQADEEPPAAALLKDELAEALDTDKEGLKTVFEEVHIFEAFHTYFCSKLAQTPADLLSALREEGEEYITALTDTLFRQASTEELFAMLSSGGVLDEVKEKLNAANEALNEEVEEAFVEESTPRFKVPAMWQRLLDTQDKHQKPLPKWNIRQAKQHIYEIYQHKAKIDAQSKRDGLPLPPMDSFLVATYHERYGALAVVHQRLKALLEALAEYGTPEDDLCDPFVYSFSRFCGIHDPLDSHTLTLYLVAFAKCARVSEMPDKHKEQNMNYAARHLDLPRMKISSSEKLLTKLTEQLSGQDRNVVYDLIKFQYEAGFGKPIQQCQCIPVDSFMELVLKALLAELSSQQAFILETFDALDTSGDGFLSFSEFIEITAEYAAFKTLSPQTSRQLYCEYVDAHADATHPGELSKAGFEELCRSQLGRHLCTSTQNAANKSDDMTLLLTTGIKQTFDKYDTDRSNSLSEKELQELLVELGESPSTLDIKLKFNFLDLDSNGGVDFNEFVTYFREKAIKRIFVAYDGHHTGEIELKNTSTEGFLSDLGVDVESDHIKTMCIAHPLDRNGDGKITYAEFIDWWTEFDIHAVFSSYDHDGSGSVDITEMQNCCRNLGLPLTDQQVRQAFKKLDVDNSHDLEFSEFYSWWKMIAKSVTDRKLQKRLQLRGTTEEEEHTQLAYIQSLAEQEDATAKAKEEQWKLLTKVAAEYGLDTDEVLAKFANGDQG